MNQHGLLKNKLYLYLTEFFAGVSVMAVELGASRLLAPYFSSSQIVWTIIIGTIMIAMALGNIWGGRAADKNPDPAKLYGRLIIAAVWIGFIPILGKLVILGISVLLVFAIEANFLMIAAFLSCAVVFVFPLFLLGTVTPSLVKYTMESMEDSGRTVGRLNAFNTVGSIIGTFLPTFVTIPAVGTAVTFYIFAGVLLVIGLIYFIAAKQGGVFCTVMTLLLAGNIVVGNTGMLSSFAFWEKNLLYEGESVYNYLQVKDTGKSVILSTNVLFGVQSVAMKDGGLTGMYYDYALAAPLMSGKLDPSILVLGMGSGTFATLCGKYFPEATIKGVEIDEKITDLAHTYFGLSDAIEVATYDGRAYLAADKERYDVIMVDAYQDITIPFQMSSVEFFTLVRDRLADNGVMVVNLNMVGDGADSINAYLCDTIASVFEDVQVVDVPGASNRELFAFKSESAAFTGAPEGFADIVFETKMLSVAQGLRVYQRGGLLLTDDKAPVELLGMRVIDSLISSELSYYKALNIRELVASLMQ